MEKLPLLVHGKPITGYGGMDNVVGEHLLRSTSVCVTITAGSSLAAFTDRCDAICAGDPGCECVVFRDLSAGTQIVLWRRSATQLI